MSKPERFIGIHLAGANSHKTCLVVLAPQDDFFEIDRIHNHLGPKTSMSSDDRIEKILKTLSHNASVVVDAPLSVPPCTRCTRQSCPGVSYCDDTAIACLLYLDSKRGNSRKRPCNPQVHRLWDLFHNHEIQDHSSRSSLVTRARTLQKRLRNFDIPVSETSILDSIQFVPNCDYKRYRHFQEGIATRKKIVLYLEKWTREGFQQKKQFIESIELFHALICAWIAFLHSQKQTLPVPNNFPKEESFPLIPPQNLVPPQERFKTF